VAFNTHFQINYLSRVIKSIRWCALLGAVAFIGIACDPLGDSVQSVSLLPNKTASPTPLPAVISPTPTPSPTITPTATPTPNLTMTAVAATCSDTTGQLVDDSFDSKIARGKVAYRAYLPPCYWTSNRRYPYVILMHGSDGDQTEWTDQLHIDKTLTAGILSGDLPPMILIMPNGGKQQNLNIFAPASSFETLILNELIPAVESNFCTWNARDGRAIGGISRGGFWSIEIGFRHPELFGAVAGHSPFFDPANAPPANNPLNLAKTVTFPPGLQPRLWTDSGEYDYARPNIELYVKALKARNIDPAYTDYPKSQHWVASWITHVPDYLKFYGATWPQDVTALPSCLQ
jgi:enterochelin esterase-like enzyme